MFHPWPCTLDGLPLTMALSFGCSVGWETDAIQSQSVFLRVTASVSPRDLNWRKIFFFLFMATPAAYRSSWVWGRMGATATATPDPNHICNLHQSLQQCQILKPLSKARDQTRILVDMMSGS